MVGGETPKTITEQEKRLQVSPGSDQLNKQFANYAIAKKKKKTTLPSQRDLT